MSSKKRITIYDIARKLEIGPTSVSRALNDHPQISAATKKLVLKTASKMGYRINQQAANLRTGRSKILGVIVPHIDNNFFSTIISGIEAVASEHKYQVVIAQSLDDATREKDAVESLINQRVACIMVSLACTTTTTIHLKEAIKQNIPVIQFDRTDDNLATSKVSNNVEHGILEAMEHLAKQGYKRIAHLAGPQNISIFRLRKEFYEKGLKLQKLRGSKAMIVYDCLSREQSREAAIELLTSKNPPDAIFAAVDLAALGALDAARSLKLKVPQDVGICGVSNEPFTELTTPSLTTIDQYSFNIGTTAAELFFNENAEGTKTKNHIQLIDSTLITRASTKRIK